jgi:hypothetical protein
MANIEDFDALKGRMDELNKMQPGDVVLTHADLAAFGKVRDSLYKGEPELTAGDVAGFLKVRHTLQVTSIVHCCPPPEPPPGPPDDEDGGGFPALGE